MFLLSLVLAISRILFGPAKPKAYTPRGGGRKSSSPILPKRRGQVGPVQKSIRRKVRARYR